MTSTQKIYKGGEYLFTEASKEEVFTPEDFSAEQRQLAATIDQFMINEVLPNIEKLENHDFRLMVSLLKKSGDLGLLMIEAPEEDGGLGLNKATSMLAMEKISGYGAFMVAYMALTGIGMLPLLYYGIPEQKEKYLGKLISGEWISAYCLTEPDAGTDALGAKTTATLSSDGKHYILNGTKQFITNGGFADLYTVFAKVDRKHFTAFLVERSSKGVSTGPEENKMGLKGSSTTQVILEDVLVPVDNVLGEIGKGHKIAFNVLNIGRFKLGAATTGAAKAALVESVKYANLRKQFNVPIGTFGAIKEKIANMVAAIFVSESLVYRLAGMIDDKLATIPKDISNYFEVYQQGVEEYAIECAIAKVFCSEMLARVADETVQIHGGYGFIQEYPAERFYRDERVNRIYEGTNEINRILILGILMRRMGKDGLPMDREVKSAREALAKPLYDNVDSSEPFAVEKTLLRNQKTVFLGLIGSVLEKFGNRVNDQQEILIALADVAINVFALESAVLRAEKIAKASGPAKTDFLKALIKVSAFNYTEAITLGARKAACFIEEGDGLPSYVDAIQRLTRYDASRLLHAKHQLASAALEAEKYVCEF